MFAAFLFSLEDNAVVSGVKNERAMALETCGERGEERGGEERKRQESCNILSTLHSLSILPSIIKGSDYVSGANSVSMGHK